MRNPEVIQNTNTNEKPKPKIPMIITRSSFTTENFLFSVQHVVENLNQKQM